MSEQAEKKSFKQTLNLPRTAFGMKANLVQNEPASIKRWDKLDVYGKLRAKGDSQPRGRFVFHDGPPYANGSIHLGHLLNKVLKDFVVRTKTMAGYDVPYIPGWDCHGLPIEHKVLSEQRTPLPPGEGGEPSEPGEGAAGRGGSSQAGSPASAEHAAAPSGSASPHPSPVPGVPGGEGVGADVMKIRRKCKSYAEKFVKLQATQMQRLLTTADYEFKSDDPKRGPYLTMDPHYEAGVLEVFAKMVERDVVYRGLKPVHWSIENQTALAEAELEYYEREDTSVYVRFPVGTIARVSGNDDERWYEIGRADLLIWTTTPWTLPANLAVAVAAKAEYGVYQTNGRDVVVACDLADKVLGAAGVKAGKPTHIFRGEELIDVQYDHPFCDRPEDGIGRRVVTADYVTLEDGTGLVHTAPGHGVEDYQTGLREGLDIYCPVQADGTFDNTAPDWLRGKNVWEANDLVVERLRDSGHLFHAEKFTHSYPHDWRGKTPVIFRATEQWFLGVDQSYDTAGQSESIRKRAIAAAERDITFHPDWGRNRLRGMLESRPDWCLSRQRSWGLPIPAFYLPDGQSLLTAASVRAVAKFVKEKGSDAWFLAEPADILADYDPAADGDAPSNVDKTTLTKGADTFDVWFESGSSWYACMQQRGLARDSGPVTDLYLEGSDQHRGWFQHSLIPALVVTGQSAFASVLTHGFMVDKDGRKMSKSLGNTLEVEELLKTYGADVCRWWVSSLNTDNDIKVDESFFKLAGEEYRKVRNTIRFILSNLSDFTFATDKVRFEDTDATSIDAWATGEIIKLSDTVRAAYDSYHFRRGHEALFNFCNDTMSAMYLAAVKDRLYCDAPGSARRRRTQTTLHRIADVLIRLLAPVMPHTADEAWRTLTGDDDACVHLLPFADVDCMRNIPVDSRWAKVIAARDGWLKAIEAVRAAGDIDNPLDLCVVAPSPEGLLDGFDGNDLADLCGVSRFEPAPEGADVSVRDLRAEPRCERSWKRDGTVKRYVVDGVECMLSARDAEAVGAAG